MLSRPMPKLQLRLGISAYAALVHHAAARARAQFGAAARPPHLPAQADGCYDRRVQHRAYCHAFVQLL